jgi:hypothetical protein
MMKSQKAPESASCCPPAPPAAVVVLVVVVVVVIVVVADVVCLDPFRSWALLLVSDFANVTAAEVDDDCRCGEESVSLTVVDIVVVVVMSREAWKRSRL